MIVAIDCGNSAVKAALVDGGRVARALRLDDFEGTATEAQLRSLLEDLVASSTEVPRGVLVASVVDRWADPVARVAGALDLPLTIVASGDVPIRTAVEHPDQTGVDRLLGAWAAASLYGSPLIVIDLGTATTVDAVDADGVFLGGAILPGAAVSIEAVVAHAPRLPRIALGEPDDAIGRDTVAAMRSGIVIGQVGAVRELVSRMRVELEASSPGARERAARVVVTGGHARAAWARRGFIESAGPGLPAIADHVDVDLLLKGLGLLAERLAAGTVPA